MMMLFSDIVRRRKMHCGAEMRKICIVGQNGTSSAVFLKRLRRACADELIYSNVKSCICLQCIELALTI
ncbi:hypothetical protein GmarT_22840 [Gimesia maris]|uniref:Uncharacterized protein n=1 Tax=Gimesia maris TaxID=122 RepID=A0ABX5YLC8_9PLAN|nr:hypothetical protein CA11_22470 [Gimesia maris]QEG16420.1 hypothetical protein GmarT_22840 [Gimesia maris]